MPETKLMSKQIPVKWVYPEDIVPRVVQNMTCSYQEGFFLLSFFETWQPEMFGRTPEEKQKVFDSLKEVEAKCVAKIVVTPEKMKDFVRALNESVTNAEKLLEARALLQAEEEKGE